MLIIFYLNDKHLFLINIDIRRGYSPVVKELIKDLSISDFH